VARIAHGVGADRTWLFRAIIGTWPWGRGRISGSERPLMANSATRLQSHRDFDELVATLHTESHDVTYLVIVQRDQVSRY
jgi:hypothetical protein